MSQTTCLPIYNVYYTLLIKAELNMPDGILPNSFSSGFYYGNGYFDNDNAQTLFLDGILMDIMVDNGEM